MWRMTAGATKGQPLSIYYEPVPENTTLLDVLYIALLTRGLTTLRQRKSNGLVNGAAESSPVRRSLSFVLCFS